ncbi:hypothetical protein FO519_007982 [Halicephalobus sp. NKZ332]|nr:hypothetical protein FO519_007982 [Halicephalobus sp. NKZ332]
MVETANFENSHLIIAFRIFIGFLAIIGNSFILLVFFKFQAFRNQFSNVLIAMLAFSDIAIGFGILITALFPLLYDHEPGTDYNRFICCLKSYPICLGINCSQVTFIALAFDRLMAVKLRHRYTATNFKWRIVVIIISWIISGVILLYFLCFTISSTPSNTCAVGSNVSMLFHYYFIFVGLLVGVVIFGVYSYAYFLLRNLMELTTSGVKLYNLNIQRRVFISISVILLSYFILYIIPLIILTIAFVIEHHSLLGATSIIIGITSDLNSCVGIFIYLYRHEEIKKYLKILMKRNQNSMIFTDSVLFTIIKKV